MSNPSRRSTQRASTARTSKAPAPAAAAARPRQRRKDARPGEIIAASLAEFAQHGFAATKLDDVARRAGVVKGTIYRYFANKEALFEAALRSRVTPMHAEIEQLIDTAPGSASALLERVFAWLYDPAISADLHVLLSIIITEGARFPAITRLYYDELVSRGRGILDRIVARGVRAGEFRAGPAADLALVLAAPVVLCGVWRLAFAQFDPIAPERFAAAHRDLVLNGLLRQPKGARGKPAKP